MASLEFANVLSAMQEVQEAKTALNTASDKASVAAYELSDAAESATYKVAYLGSGKLVAHLVELQDGCHPITKDEQEITNATPFLATAFSVHVPQKHYEVNPATILRGYMPPEPGIKFSRVVEEGECFHADDIEEWETFPVAWRLHVPLDMIADIQVEPALGMVHPQHT